MSFKKLKPEVVEVLKIIGIEELNDDAKLFFTAIKSGKNSLITAPVATGKTTTAIVSILNKVNQAYEGSPRAVYITDTIEKAEKLHKKLTSVSRKLDITVDLVHDKGNMIQQRNDIFDGTEIVIGNPKRVHDLYLQNGINFKLLELFIIDDLDLCLSAGKQSELKRLIESLEEKTQLLLFTNTYSKKVNTFVDSLEIPLTQIEQNDTV
jgi:ATP-dependent RNA helicase RhlE